MADPHTPQYHGYQDRLGSNPRHKHLDYAELKARADAKREDFKRTQALLEDTINIEEYENIPREGLAEVEHYNAMEDVEIDPEVSEFWKAQQEGLETPKAEMAAGKSEYESAYQEWQNLLENMDDRRRDELGVNNIDQREAQAKEGVKQAKERLKDAKRKVKDIQYDVDPFKAMIGAITGTSKEVRTIKEAHRGVREAKKGVKAAKRSLQQVRETRAALEEKKASLSVKEYSVLRRMSDAQVKIENARETARQIVEGGEKGSTKTADVRNRLQEQYKLIEKYRAIQTLKNSNNYPAISRYLETSNPDLFNQMERIPQTMPKGSFRVTLSGPLQLPVQSEKIADIDQKIAELKRKLPNNIDMSDLSNELSTLKLKDSDTIESITAELSNPDITEKRREQLEIQKAHLELKAKIEDRKKEIQTLTNEIKTEDFSGKDEELQKKLENLKTKQDHLKILQDELANDTYSQRISNLSELQKLSSERESLDMQNDLEEKINSTTEGLENTNSRVTGEPVTISSQFLAMLNYVIDTRKRNVELISVRNGKNPEQTQDQKNEQDGRG